MIYFFMENLFFYGKNGVHFFIDVRFRILPKSIDIIYGGDIQ